MTDFDEFGFVYDSLADMTDAVHLVVKGQVVGLRHGVFFPYETSPLEGATPTPLNVLLLQVAVGEELKGKALSRDRRIIEIRVYSSEDEALLRANLPTHEHIFFLMNDAQWRADLGFPARDAENERHTYVRPNGYQAVLRNVDGSIAAIRPARRNDPFANAFPITLDGVQLSEVVATIEQAADD